MNWLKHKSALLFAIGILSFSSISTWLVAYVPSNMDEFLPYHRIACSVFPNAIEHVFTESCTAYPIRWFGFDFFRSYSYVGYTSNLLYLPFYSIFPAPVSHHLLGAFILVIFSLLLVKAFSLPKLTAVIPLIYFPLLFQVIHDTGPIRIALLTYPLVALLASKLFDGNETLLRKISYFLGIFLIVSFAIEDKPFYVYLLPQVLFLALGFAFFHHGHGAIKFTVTKERMFFDVSKNLLLGTSLVFLAAFFAGILILIFMTVPLGQKGNYYPYLAQLVLNSSSKISFLQETKYIAGYLFSPVLFASRIYEISVSSALVSAFAFTPTLIVCLLALKNEQKHIRFLILGTIGLGCAIFLFARNTWSGHHFIFLHIPILILLMRYAGGGTKKYAYVVASAFISVIVSCVQLSSGKQAVHSESNRQLIYEYLSRNEIASNAIINFASWGGYYQQSLYGAKTQLVTYIDPMTKESADSLVEAWVRSGRKGIINVCSACDAQTISSFFPGYTASTIDFPGTSWRLVKIER